MAASTIFCIHCGAANPQQAKFCFSCGQQVLEANETRQLALLQPGALLKQRFKILGQIGQGGFGAVYKVEDKGLGQRLLAVKEMSQHNLRPQEILDGVEAFKREALMLAGLKHEHLPHIYDHFSENDRWYLVMDYIEGETLEARLAKSRDGSLPPVMALKIARQLCEVLAYLHTRQPPIIFRDLKPANIILTPEGGLCLIDFGIARHFKPGQAKDTVAFGSPGYAAPEQYGKTQTTPRADIYSLGTIIHQMISGDDPSLSPLRFAPLTNQDTTLKLLCQQMLEMDEAKRPSTIAVVQSILQRVRDMSPVVSAIAANPAASVHPSSTPIAPILPPSPVAPVLVHKHHYGLVRAVAWSPDSLLAASATDAIIRVWSVRNGQNIASHREHIGPIKHMTWSPTAMCIASISAENKVHIWDAHTGVAICVYPGDPGFNQGIANTLAWSRDGRYMAVGGHGYIYIWDTSTHDLTAKVKHRSHEYLSISWSPDGKTLAAAYESKIAIWYLPTGKRVSLYHYHAPINVVAWSPDGHYLASGGQDQVVRVWDMHSQTPVTSYYNHIRPICALAWSPDSKRIVSSSLAGNVNVWEVATGQGIVSYYAHSGAALAVAWSPDGASILSGGSDRRVCVWHAP